jgi:nucleotide-binding universal stress UspA family protein
MDASALFQSGNHPDALRHGEPRESLRPGGRVIVGIDDSPAGLAALRWSVGRVRGSGAKLVAVRSWALGLPRHGGRHHRHLARPRVVLYFDGAEQREASAKLVRRAFRIANGGMPRDVTVTVATPEGDPGAALTGMATAPGDMIVIGEEGVPRWRRIRRGSVSRWCMQHANCPVVVVPLGEEHDRGAEPTGGCP